MARPDVTASAPARAVWVPIGVFLVVSAVASPLLALLQSASGADPEVLRLTVLSTAVGAAVVLVALRPLPCPPVARRGVAVPLATGAAAVAAFLLVLLPLRSLGAVSVPLGPAALPVPLVAALALQVLGAAAEEVGWRGIVQPALETRVAPLAAWLGTGLVFGLGHVYVVGAGLVVFALFVVSAVALSVVLGALTTGRSTLERVVVATAVHWGVNVGLLLGFHDGAESAAWVGATALAMVVVAVPVVLLTARGRRPGRA